MANRRIPEGPAKPISIRIPQKILKQMPAPLSGRTEWMLEAITEKLEREATDEQAV